MTCPRCKKEIAEHVAGRGLDACVAEVVMGWTNVEIEQGIDWQGKAYKSWFGVRPGKKWGDDVAAYSTDPAAMMEVIEHCKSRYTGSEEFGMCMEYCEAVKKWYACCGSGTDSVMSSESLACAVCLATLAACAKEKEKQNV